MLDWLTFVSAAAVAGHSGKIRSVRVGDLRALVFLSRTHYYEGKGVAAVVHGVRTAARTGCRAIVLTNGCGGLKHHWVPGTPVLISDHINLTATSPIEGANFVDLTDLYSSRLRTMSVAARSISWPSGRVKVCRCFGKLCRHTMPGFIVPNV